MEAVGAGHQLSQVNRWKVLYDGDCGLCKWLLAGLLLRDREQRLVPVALQRPEAEELLPGMPLEERMASFHLISPSGERFSGGAALSKLLGLLPGGRLPGAAMARVPWVTDRAYRWVADNRALLSRPVPAAAKQRAGAYVERREARLPG